MTSSSILRVTDQPARTSVSGHPSPTETATYTLMGPDRHPYQSTVKGILGGHKGDRVYGRLDCPAALRAITKGGYRADRVFFADEATAIAAGFRPCAACLPKRYAAWKEQTRKDQARKDQALKEPAHNEHARQEDP